MSGLDHAIQACRPRTLSLALTPVGVGACLARGLAGELALAPVLVAAFSAMMIQIGTNLFNDVGDFSRGGDGPDRLGPPRAAASGWFSPGAMKRAAAGCFALAALGGLYLVFVGGGPILALGLASILSGLAYSGGPRPLSHTPLAELFVIAFFGLGATGGTYFLATGRLDAAALVAGLALGCFAAAVLLVNNLRDAAPDARNGRRTLAILLGRRRGEFLYAALVAAPFLLLAPLSGLAPHKPFFVALLVSPVAAQATRALFRAQGAQFNALLGATARLQMFFGLALAIAALW